MLGQGLADRVQGLAHGFRFVVCTFAQAVRGDLKHQVGEVELEGQHGLIVLLIKYVINGCLVKQPSFVIRQPRHDNGILHDNSICVTVRL